MNKFHSLILLVTYCLVTGCSGTKEPLPQGMDATWDLVIIGDSSLWKLGLAYAAKIEEAMGVQVEVHDFANNAGSAGEVLEVLKGNTNNLRLEGLPDILSEAEVVVMFVNPEDSVDPGKPMDFGGCFMYQAPKNCQLDTFARYTDDLEKIWSEILKLRKGKETILRAVDFYNPLVSGWQEKGVFEACNECWENMSLAIRAAAEEKNIPFLSRLDAYNGLDHTEDPRLKGYIDEDGEHPSALGAAFTAELLADMGFVPVNP